jgi:hypothetical protein
VAFEPAAANFHVLARNTAINQLGERSLGVLNLASDAMGSSLSQFGAAGDKSPYHRGSISSRTACSDLQSIR